MCYEVLEKTGHWWQSERPACVALQKLSTFGGFKGSRTELGVHVSASDLVIGCLCAACEVACAPRPSRDVTVSIILGVTDAHMCMRMTHRFTTFRLPEGPCSMHLSLLYLAVQKVVPASTEVVLSSRCFSSIELTSKKTIVEPGLVLFVCWVHSPSRQMSTQCEQFTHYHWPTNTTRLSKIQPLWVWARGRERLAMYTMPKQIMGLMQSFLQDDF